MRHTHDTSDTSTSRAMDCYVTALPPHTGLALADLPALNPLPHLSYLGLHALPRELHDRRAAVATALSRHPSLQFVHATHAHGARGPGFMLLRTRGRLHELASVAVGEVGAGGRGGGRH